LEAYNAASNKPKRRKRERKQCTTLAGLGQVGYDPGAAVSFFEKLQAKESAKPGTVSKMFSTHPPTGDRIAMSKKNIELILPDKDQYIVTTSEFNQVKALLAELERRQPALREANKPSLRRRTQPPPRD